MAEKQGNRRGSLPGKECVDGAARICGSRGAHFACAGIDEYDEVRVEAAGIRAARIDGAAKFGAKETATAPFAGEKEGLGEGEGDGVAFLEFEKLDAPHAGFARHAVGLGLAHIDAEGVAAMGSAQVRLASERRCSRQHEGVGAEALADVIPGGNNPIQGGVSGHSSMVVD